MSATTTPAVPSSIVNFNYFISDIYNTILPRGYDMREFTSDKYPIWDVIFGRGTFGPVGARNKELIATDAFKFEDSALGVPGVKAKGFKESAFRAAMAEAEAMKTDTALMAELKAIFLANPDYKHAINRITDELITIFLGRQAQCMVQLAQEYEAEMEQQSLDMGNPDLVYGFIQPPTSDSKFSKYLRFVKDKVLGITKANTIDAYKTIVNIKDEIEKKVGNSASIMAWAGIYSGVRGIFGKIPILLGPVPLKHVDYVEIARSGKILKFRATGTVFLAKQEGGDDAIKIEGTMYKAEFLLMFALWALFIYGQSKFKDMEDIPLFNISSTTSVFNVRKLNDIIMTDTSLEKPSYEFHQTFPFVSRHFIIPNCWVETISIEDKLPLKDVLKYTILLRTYDKPKEVTWIEGKRGKALYGIKNKTYSAKICEASLNAGWRILNSTGWLIDETEWKIGSALNEGVLDTYYDVDWSTFATVAYLSLMGVMV